MKGRVNIRGFSLLETLIASLLAMALGGVLLTMLSRNIGLSYKENAIVSGGIGVNSAMDQITNFINQASFVTSGYPAVNPTYTSSSSTLVLGIPAMNSSGVIPSVYDYVIVSVDTSLSNVLRLRVFPDAQSIRKSQNLVLTPLLGSIQFTYNDKSGNVVSPTAAFQVGVNLIIQSGTGSVTASRSASTVTTLLNAP